MLSCFSYSPETNAAISKSDFHFPKFLRRNQHQSNYKPSKRSHCKLRRTAQNLFHIDVLIQGQLLWIKRQKKHMFLIHNIRSSDCFISL